MRERWARWLAATTGVLVLLAAGLFALLQNPPRAATDAVAEPAPRASAPGSEPGVAPRPPVPADAGRAVFQAQHCTRCHAVAGQGNPRSPLDDVGARLTRAQLRDWVLAAEAVQDDLSRRAIEAKSAYATLPAAELEALLDYLQTLRVEQGGRGN